MGFPSVARVGSCALTAVIVGNKVYSANLGDSKGIIVNVNTKANEKAYKKINHTLNANSKKEQMRLKSIFSDDDIVVCKRGNKSCYVKGRLQPTRSLGDFRLKFQEFNNPKNVTEDKGYLKSISNFQGPYIIVFYILQAKYSILYEYEHNIIILLFQTTAFILKTNILWLKIKVAKFN